MFFASFFYYLCVSLSLPVHPFQYLPHFHCVLFSFSLSSPYIALFVMFSTFQLPFRFFKSPLAPFHHLPHFLCDLLPFSLSYSPSHVFLLYCPFFPQLSLLIFKPSHALFQYLPLPVSTSLPLRPLFFLKLLLSLPRLPRVLPGLSGVAARSGRLPGTHVTDYRQLAHSLLSWGP